ncbi:LysR family transcriptional regulator (plasmid) [Aliisedimentitalea scapharcae]|uniref:LysR family transcriptional regulator n=1 Tax=Aliisedimentitalea scapharcae TaxID=1524259 RepID=A0ABZ2Y2I0_9RHOB
MAIKIEMLRCFSVVAQVGNLSEAAQRLGRTQSAISMTLKQLEEHLGQRLFEGERKNSLTGLGQQVFELAQIQLRQFDDTIKTIETSAQAPRGLIRIASIPSVAGLVFPSAIETMTRRHPQLMIELRDTDTQQVIDALFQGQADLGVVSGEHVLNGIRNLPLFDDEFGLICAPDHPLALQRDTPDLADVMAAGFVMNALCNQIETRDFRAAFGECNVTVHNTLSLISMVHTRNWVTILPRSVAHLTPHDLRFRQIRGLHDRRQVHLLLRERSQFKELASELADLVKHFDWEKKV